MTRFLATGDSHLGAGARYGLEPFGPRSRLVDQDRNLQLAADLAITEEVDFVLYAGDAFHRRRPSPSELKVFDRFIDRLALEGMRVVAVAGNHDVEAPDRPTALEVFTRPNLTVHRVPGVTRLATAQVAALPWAPLSSLAARRDGASHEELCLEASELLVEQARGLRAQCTDDLPAVLLAHWSVSGATLPNGMDVRHLAEPVLPVPDLEALGFDAVVLGHIHKPQLLGSEDARGPILYVGSPGVVDFGEAAVEHGCWLLNTDAAPSHEFMPLEDRRFLTVEVDLTGPAAAGGAVSPDGVDHDETDAVAATIASHLPLDGAVVRLRYRATPEQARRMDVAALRRLCADGGGSQVFVEPELVRAGRSRAEGLSEDAGPLDALEAWARSQWGAAFTGMPEWTKMRERAKSYLEEDQT